MPDINVPYTSTKVIDTTDTPQPLGTASAGTGVNGVSPNDHVHAMPALTSLTDQDVTNLATGTMPVWNATAGKFQQVAAPLWATLTSGCCTLPRVGSYDSASYGNPTTGVEHFTYFRADKSMTVGHINFQIGGTAAATSTYAAVGLYTVSSGTLTLVASTANQTGWTNAYYSQSPALTVSYAISAGIIYAVGILQVATTTASFYGAPSSSGTLGNAPALAGTKSGQSTLASSTSALTNATFPINFELLV
jgi:hypothetical protein